MCPFVNLKHFLIVPDPIMRSINHVIAGNSLAILLTVVILLPTTAVVAFVATGPIDDFFANIGIWLHRANGTLARLDM